MLILPIPVAIIKAFFLFCHRKEQGFGWAFFLFCHRKEQGFGCAVVHFSCFAVKKNKDSVVRFHRPEGFILVLPEKNQDSWRRPRLKKLSVQMKLWMSTISNISLIRL